MCLSGGTQLSCVRCSFAAETDFSRGRKGHKFFPERCLDSFIGWGQKVMDQILQKNGHRSLHHSNWEWWRLGVWVCVCLSCGTRLSCVRCSFAAKTDFSRGWEGHKFFSERCLYSFITWGQNVVDQILQKCGHGCLHHLNWECGRRGVIVCACV